jgi:hypothetical protein
LAGCHEPNQNRGEGNPVQNKSEHLFVPAEERERQVRAASSHLGGTGSNWCWNLCLNAFGDLQGPDVLDMHCCTAASCICCDVQMESIVAFYSMFIHLPIITGICVAGITYLQVTPLHRVFSVLFFSAVLNAAH